MNHKKPQEKIEPPNKTLNQTKTRQQNIEQKPKTEQVSNTISNNFNNSNRSSSITFTGNESEYGLIMTETKKCKPCEATDIGKAKNLNITLSKPEKKEVDF